MSKKKEESGTRFVAKPKSGNVGAIYDTISKSWKVIGHYFFRGPGDVLAYDIDGKQYPKTYATADDAKQDVVADYQGKSKK